MVCPLYVCSPHCYDKLPNRKLLQDGRVYFGSQSEGILSTVVAKAWRGLGLESCSRCICSQEAERYESLGSACLLPSIQSGAPARRAIPPAIKVGLPASANPI